MHAHTITKIGIQLESFIEMRKNASFCDRICVHFWLLLFAAAILEAKRNVFRVNRFFPKAFKKVNYRARFFLLITPISF